MAQVILYNPNSPTVPNRVTDYLRSVQSSDYQSNPNAIIYEDPSGDPPDVQALLDMALPRSRWKVSGGVVVALSAQDLTDLAAADAAAQAAANAAAIAFRRATAKDRIATDNELRAAVLALLDVIVPEINTLRAQHSLAARTVNNVAQAVKTAFDNRVDNWP